MHGPFVSSGNRMKTANRYQIIIKAFWITTKKRNQDTKRRKEINKREIPYTSCKLLYLLSL